ncbi:lipoprotein [Enterococcus sp. BWM-S5]|uniref:Lipoprotein n=1 Tax=Enterococcus larvae TaxID=2794352 RepID=A0ABS4CII1_9ENTE|nr:lipoprotein [Enterococcus larvae]MBP1045805.1 lipoprotein [Enterococcus larvae]
MKKIALLLVALVLLAGCSSSVTEEIEVSKNKIASFYKAVGAKEIVHTELTYGQGEISEDELLNYVDYLKEEEDFEVGEEFQIDSGEASIRLEKRVDDMILTVTVIYQADWKGEVTIIYSSDTPSAEK